MLKILFMLIFGLSSPNMDLTYPESINAYAVVWQEQVEPPKTIDTTEVGSSLKVEKDVKQLYFITSKGCAPCFKVKKEEFPKLKDSGWTFGEKGNIREFSFDDPALEPYNKNGPIDSVPTFIVVRNGKEVARAIGYMTYLEIAKFHNEN